MKWNEINIRLSKKLCCYIRNEEPEGLHRKRHAFLTRASFFFFFISVQEKQTLKRVTARSRKCASLPPTRRRRRRVSFWNIYFFKKREIYIRPWEELWWGKRASVWSQSGRHSKQNKKKSRSQIRKDGPDLHCFYTWKNSIVITEILEIIKYS